MIENRLEITISGPEPTVTMSTSDIGKFKLNFSLFCPTTDAMEIEQKLTRDFLELWVENSTKKLKGVKLYGEL